MAQRVSTNLEQDALDALAAFTPVRVSIIALLRTDEPATRAHISAQLGLQTKTALYHLGQLQALSVVETEPPLGAERSGQRILYRLNAVRVRELHATLGRALGI
ncbi:MAG: winged helix-turn-helix domain-containing protein [Leifsonia sp.]